MSANIQIFLKEMTASLSERSAISSEDVLALRQLVWGDARVSQEEADAIMALNAACQVRTPEWIDYFVEVMVDYVVHQQRPVGYVDQEKASWLMRWIDKDGQVASLGELELLIKILEQADSVPASLQDYALQQIEKAVLSHEGPTRHVGRLGTRGPDAEGINEVEVDLLRRIIFAQSSNGGYVVSASEAEMLFRLKDATLRSQNAPGFADLFVKAVANHLFAHRNYQTLSKEDQVKLETYEADTHVHLGRFFARMIGRSQSELPGAALAIADIMKDSEAAAAADHVLTQGETEWVIGQIRADGNYDPLEKLLVAFIRAET